MKGTLNWFNVNKNFDKNYGYITDEDGNVIFANETGIKNDRTYTGFNEGDQVEFETQEGRKGVHATDVTLCDGE